MPAPFAVCLVDHDPEWRFAALAEAARLRDAFCGLLVDVQHVGSTSIPGLVAKPILDLMPVARDVASLDSHAYADAKSSRIQRTEHDAFRWYRAQAGSTSA